MRLNLDRIIRLGILALLAAGCLPQAASEPIQPVQITFHKRGYVEGGTDVSSKMIAGAVQAFEASHPQIDVKVVGVPWGPEGSAQLKAALESGEDIHVLSVSSIELPDFARRGLLSNIEPYLSEQDQADFYSSALDAATVDGKVYAWPLWVTAVAIYANPALFEQRGVAMPSLDDPWTWDEFVEAAKQLTFQQADGAQVYGFSAASKPGLEVYLPLFYIDGGRVLSPDGKRFVQNSPEAVSALQKIADLGAVHQVTPPDWGDVDQVGARTQFKNGALAMLMDTPATISEFEQENVSFDVLPTPMGALGKTVTTGAFGMYGVANVADQAELQAAHEFARYLTGSQVALDVPGYQLAPGLRRSNKAFATNEARSIITRLVSFGIYEPPAIISTDLRAHYGALLQAILLGQRDPQEAMDEIAPEYQAELDEASP
jgi:multiple sugar transport system substrate-binding protein